MGAWIVVGLAALVGLAVAIVALFAPRGRPEPTTRRPLWLLPHPREVLRPGFRRALHGYDPAEVDAHLEAVAIAYAALHDAAGAEAVTRAEREIARRLGQPLPTDERDPDAGREPSDAEPDEPGAMESEEAPAEGPEPGPQPRPQSDPEVDVS